MKTDCRLEKKLLNYTSKAIAKFKMISAGDRVMVCLSGGKDSYTMLKILHAWRMKKRLDFTIFAYTLDQTQPGWNDQAMRAWLEQQNIPYHIEQRDTYSVVKEKVPEGKTYCSLCSRLRRGNIYRYAAENGFNKIALGHHRDDLVQSLLLSICYNGQIKSMPPKLLSDDKKHIVIRPLVFCQEADIKQYALKQKFPLIPCNLCGSQKNLARQRMAKTIATMTAENPKIPSNILHALSSVCPSQLMDEALWDFKSLQAEEESTGLVDTVSDIFVENQ